MPCLPAVVFLGCVFMARYKCTDIFCPGKTDSSFCAEHFENCVAATQYIHYTAAQFQKDRPRNSSSSARSFLLQIFAKCYGSQGKHIRGPNMSVLTLLVCLDQARFMTHYLMFRHRLIFVVIFYLQSLDFFSNSGLSWNFFRPPKVCEFV